MLVGGKGANLGDLFKIEGICVPEGFCISTEAFKRMLGEESSINELLDKLSLLKVEDRDKIVEFSGEIRILLIEELHDVVRTNKLDYRIISKRKEEYKLYEKLTPPRVITSEGEHSSAWNGGVCRNSIT